MKILIKKNNPKGFSLTEVMIGMMILTVAIVSASNLLVGLLTSNQNNLSTLQAYYLAQEGIEAMRNIRDTNWLHNRDWLGQDGELWGENFQIPSNIAAEGDDCGDTVNCYVVDLEAGAFSQSANSGEAKLDALRAFRPWSVRKGQDGKIFRRAGGAQDVILAGSVSGSVDSGFRRTIMIKKYDCGPVAADFPCAEEDVDKYVLVQAKVEWKLGAKDREIILSEVLTDWKGGAL